MDAAAQLGRENLPPLAARCCAAHQPTLAERRWRPVLRRRLLPSLGRSAGWVQIGRMTPHVAGIVLWAVFLISWYVAMAWIAPAVRRNSVASRLGDNVVYALGFF